MWNVACWLSLPVASMVHCTLRQLFDNSQLNANNMDDGNKSQLADGYRMHRNARGNCCLVKLWLLSCSSAQRHTHTDTRWMRCHVLSDVTRNTNMLLTQSNSFTWRSNGKSSLDSELCSAGISWYSRTPNSPLSASSAAGSKNRVPGNVISAIRTVT